MDTKCMHLFYSCLKIATLSPAVPTVQVFTESACVRLPVILLNGEEPQMGLKIPSFSVLVELSTTWTF